MLCRDLWIALGAIQWGVLPGWIGGTRHQMIYMGSTDGMLEYRVRQCKVVCQKLDMEDVDAPLVWRDIGRNKAV